MAEYIEREAAIDFVKNNTPNIDGETTMRCVERSLGNVPAADVVEVRHGYWKKLEGMDLSYQCSECKGYYTKHAASNSDYDYCPHCGAKMDGKDGAE